MVSLVISSKTFDFTTTMILFQFVMRIFEKVQRKYQFRCLHLYNYVQIIKTDVGLNSIKY